jgi:hypothetical protein
MTLIEAMRQALEALENSVDLVVEDAYNAEKLYGKYPTRQAKVGGLKLLADAHQQAITALRTAIAEAEKQEPFGYFQYAPHFDAWVQNRDSNKGVAFYTTPPAASGCIKGDTRDGLVDNDSEENT